VAEQYIAGRYRLDRKVLAGDPRRGVPDVWQASDAGDIYYVKMWRRRSADAEDVQALWNREVRGLMRLQGFPGASELFARLHHLDADEKHYFAILEGGKRQLLSAMLADRSRFNWLQNLSEVTRRRPLWEGLLRVAEALAILHKEGTLHRSLSSKSIFAGTDGQGDFRLSGFEWSLRIAGRDGAASRPGSKETLSAPELDREATEYSTATDWFDFGIMAAELFGIELKNFKKRFPLRSAIDRLTHLNQSEKSTILQLIEENPEQRLCDDQAVLQTLRNILRDLTISAANAGRSIVLAVRLSSDTDLSKQVEIASLGLARADDPLRQQAWIESDLRGDFRLVARMVPFSHFVLKGASLEYRVRQWDVNGGSTWNIGYCDSVEQIPRVTIDEQYFSIGQRKIEIMRYPQVLKSVNAIRDRAAPWDKLFPFRQTRVKLAPHLRDVHDFFRVTQQLDTVIIAAQICPVEVVEFHRSSSETEVELTPKSDPDRNELAQALNLASPAEQLREWFRLGVEAISVEDEDLRSDQYALLNRRTIANDASSETAWKFVGAEQRATGPVYRFRCQGNPPVRKGIAYLAKSYGGSIAQIRRRHKAIEDMRSHEMLLQNLADPSRTTRRNNDTLPGERASIALDPSKLKALEAVWQTQPLFAIQGPPGTGKTTLIKAFADRLMNFDPSAQILVTAHSHHTVDDVLGKVNATFNDIPASKRPIVLRLGGSRTDPHSVSKVTKALVDSLATSDMALNSPRFLRDRLADVIAATEDPETTHSDTRTLQLLVQDAANLTFSTLNSGELADLAERGRRFDWSIIEEAGKAHGFDMAVALAESHRLLLIGDHFQLPPFNAKIFKQLLADPLRVKKAIQLGAQFAPGLIDVTLVEEEDGREWFVDRCERWRSMVELFAAVFASSSDGTGRAPVATLTDQHRMHPDIAAIVGQSFYPDLYDVDGTILKSPEETHARFSESPPFYIKEGSWLPGNRVVWCDVPWIQREKYAEGEQDGLFVSKVEAGLVVRVLEELQPRGSEPCEVQILSPYTNQLEIIRRAIEATHQNGGLPHMFSGPFDLREGKRLGATVDEFQGSEADVVIVSLVRNNALVPWKSLGFLKERNRMNVLLSRAKQKLIIVGSWDFFSTRCDEHTSADEEHAYLRQMMNVMAFAETTGKLGKVEAAK